MDAEEIELKKLAEHRAKYGESDAEADIEKLAAEKARQHSVPPEVIEFRRILREYLDAGLPVAEAQSRAIQDFEDVEFLRSPDSNILEIL